MTFAGNQGVKNDPFGKFKELDIKQQIYLFRVYAAKLRYNPSVSFFFCKRMKVSLNIFLILFCLLNCTSIFAQQKRIQQDTPFQKSVAKLPAVDRVEILAIERIKASRKDIDCAQPDIVCSRFPGKILASKTLSGENATKISKMWRSLEQGNGAACFAPGYVLRFYQKDKLLLTADVCFLCCNITLPNIGGDGILSMCGNEKASENFKTFVTNELPFPKREKKE